MLVMTGISLPEAPANDPAQDSSGTKVLADSLAMPQRVASVPIASTTTSSGALSEDTLPSSAELLVTRLNEQPKEFGGRDGPDPTRYGDWEKSGRCIDF